LELTLWKSEYPGKRTYTYRLIMFSSTIYSSVARKIDNSGKIVGHTHTKITVIYVRKIKYLGG